METLNYPTTFGVSTFRQRHDDYNPRCRTCRSLRRLDHRFDPSYHAGIQTLFVTLHLMNNLLWKVTPTMAHWHNMGSSIYILENMLPCLYSPWAVRLAGDDALCAIQPVSRRSCRLLKAVLQLGVHLFDQMMKRNQYRSTFWITYDLSSQPSHYIARGKSKRRSWTAETVSKYLASRALGGD